MKRIILIFAAAALPAVILFSVLTYAENKPDVNSHRAIILDLSERNKTGNTELVALKHCFEIFAIQYTVTERIPEASSAP